jgi:hypothetical protein
LLSAWSVDDKTTRKLFNGPLFHIGHWLRINRLTQCGIGSVCVAQSTIQHGSDHKVALFMDLRDQKLHVCAINVALGCGFNRLAPVTV